MAVPSSGQLRLRADIALEVDGSATGTNVSLGTLSNTAGFTDPDAMSEFYGYDSDPTRLVYISSFGGTNGPTYTSSSLWSQSNSSSEGTNCGDTIILSANPTNTTTSGQNIYYEILDNDDSLYLDSFDVYYAYNVSANTDIRIRVMAAYVSSTTGFLTTTQEQTIRNYDQTGTGTGVFSVDAAVLGSARTLIVFSFNGEDSTNSATISLYDINTKLACPQ